MSGKVQKGDGIILKMIGYVAEWVMYIGEEYAHVQRGKNVTCEVADSG